MMTLKCKMMKQMLTSLILIGVLSKVIIVSGDSSVHIYSKYRQYVTSSTLNWLPVSHHDKTKNLVIGGFQKIITNESNQNSNNVDEEHSVYVCRAFHGGIWIAGSQIEGEKKCTIGYLGEVHSYERYELLENIENSARLSWINWDQYRTIPAGTAVASDTLFIARHVVSSDEIDNNNNDEIILPINTHYIGTLDHTNTLGVITYVKNNGQLSSTTFGEVLVEAEPIYYELTSVKFNNFRTRIIKNEPKVIGKITISNSESKPAKLAEAIGYNYEYFSYWGQGHAMIKALNTTIKLINGDKLFNIPWGLEDKSERSDVYTVEIYLEPGTAVNVTLKANYKDMEVPYTGKLISHYEDGETKSRDIGGVHKEVNMFDIEPEFGPIYFIHNSTLVPTTLPPPSTTSKTTITVTTTSTTGQQSSSDSIPYTTWKVSSSNDFTLTQNTNKLDENDENMIVPPKNPDISNMQNDDGGPLSLKNKEDTVKNLSMKVINSNILILLTSLITISVNLHRIT